MQVGSKEWSFQSHQGMVDLWRAIAHGPSALLNLRCARRPQGRQMIGPIEQRNRKLTEAQAGMAMARSNRLPVFSTPKQRTSSLRMAATTICLGLMRPALFRRATRIATAGLKRIADSAGTESDDRSGALPILQ